LTAYKRRLILVRPDQYVAWAADEAPADATGILRRVIGDYEESAPADPSA
jgi:4-hydroxyisophthalate hydroxylase